MTTYRRINTIKIQFALNATRPTAMELHLWLQQFFSLTIEQVDTIQINTQEKSVYLKLLSPKLFEHLAHQHEGVARFHYSNGEVAQVTILKADIPLTTVRVFNVPPEVPNSVVQQVLSRFGAVKTVRVEQWSTDYVLPANNGVRAVKMEVKHQIPAVVVIDGLPAHVSYLGQPLTCFVCRAPGHLKGDCPQRKTSFPVHVKARQVLLSDVVAGTVGTGESKATSEVVVASPDVSGDPGPDLTESHHPPEKEDTASHAEPDRDSTQRVLQEPGVLGDVPTSRSDSDLEDGQAVMVTEVDSSDMDTSSSSTPVQRVTAQQDVAKSTDGPAGQMGPTETTRSILGNVSSRDPRLEKRSHEDAGLPSATRQKRVTVKKKEVDAT